MPVSITPIKMQELSKTEKALRQDLIDAGARPSQIDWIRRTPGCASDEASIYPLSELVCRSHSGDYWVYKSGEGASFKAAVYSHYDRIQESLDISRKRVIGNWLAHL
jgi:hypothetical protein